MFDIENRRYIGSKYKLMPWIRETLQNECENAHSFFDVFSGTGIVTSELLDCYDEFFINDFLYSNEIIYKAFFGLGVFNQELLNLHCQRYQTIDADEIPENYVSINYGNKFFSFNDAKIIGCIRQDIEDLHLQELINEKEYSILLASLVCETISVNKNS